MSERKLLREFVCELDQRLGDIVSRGTEWVRLFDRPELLVDDDNRWLCEYGTDLLSFNFNGRERKSRELFAKQVVALRSRERAAKDAGLFACGQFTVGSFVVDGA